MRIGFDAKRAYHNSTGLGNYSRDLIKILAAKYPENNYFLYNPKPKKIDRLSSFTNIFERLPQTTFWKKFSSIWRQGPIVHQIKKDSIDIFHGLSGEIPRNLHKNGIKSIVTIHDLIFITLPELYSFFNRKIYFKKFKYAAKNATKIIAISEQTKKDIIKYLKVDASKIEVVYQGCHPIFKEKTTLEEQYTLKKKYNLPSDFILNVGTIEKRKNLFSVVKAIKDIDTNLVVLGRKTSYFNEVKDFIDKHNMNSKVIFLENLSLKELSTLYQAAKIFVYPSIYEGFGIPIIEALYAKTPVITTLGGVFNEAGGPNSIYVQPTDIESLKKEITLLLGDDKLRTVISEKGFKFVQQFNDNVIVNNLTRVYKSVL